MERDPPPLVSDRGCRTGSPALRHQGKTSSSEWNSSDDLAGPFSEQEDSAYRSSNSETALPESPAPLESPGPLPPPLCPNLNSPLPPAKYAHRHAAECRTSFRPRLLQEPSQTSPRPSPKSALSHAARPYAVLHKRSDCSVGHPLSPVPSGRTGPSHHARSDSSASESSERFPSPRPSPDPEGPGEGVALTTYFTVDNCMTDTYRLKYHNQRVAPEPRGGDRGEPGDTSHTASTESEHLKPRPESGTL